MLKKIFHPLKLLANSSKILALLILLIPLKLTPWCSVLAEALRERSFPGFNLPAPVICFCVWLAKDPDAMATALREGSWHSSPALQPHVGCSREGKGVGLAGTGGTCAEEDGQWAVGLWQLRCGSMAESGTVTGHCCSPLPAVQGQLVFPEHLSPAHTVARLPSQGCSWDGFQGCMSRAALSSDSSGWVCQHESLVLAVLTCCPAWKKLSC